MSTRLEDLAKVIRSKNAGPYNLTLDVLFADAKDYRRVVNSAAITVSSMAELYKVDSSAVRVFNHPAALAIKVTFVRRVPAGSIDDTDIYGAQQHVPLYSVAIAEQ